MKKHLSTYKDNAFCILFNNPDKLRNLYNVLTESSYDKDTPVVINTLKNELSQSIVNDISFTIGEKTVVLIEHQSTINPNMPLRFLFYVTAIYERMTPRKELYGTRKLKIPLPEFYLFYNGTSPFPDKAVLKLSHSFEKSSESNNPPLELIVKAYNINAGHNSSLLKKSRDLQGYARFVALVRKKQAGQKDKDDREEAIRLAINECIDNNILKEFFEEFGDKIMKSILYMSIEEYGDIRAEEAREDALKDAREEALKEARKETRKEVEKKTKETQKKIQEKFRLEKLESARKMKAMGLSTSQIAKSLRLSPQTIKKL